MARVLVAGGLYEEEQDEQIRSARKTFAAALGREIIARGHQLLGGCRTHLDAVVAEAAQEEAVNQGLDPKKMIRSWVTAQTSPAHTYGEIVRSRVENWSQVPLRHKYPEPVEQCDVAIILGGWDGTHYAASWARLADKPLLPVAAFGLAAAEIYQDEITEFDRRYSSKLTLDEYQILDRVLSGGLSDETVNAFAGDVVSLAERLVRSTDVFVIMSFSDSGPLIDAYDTFVRVCADSGLRAFKVDDHFDAQQRIVPSIVEAIRRSSLIIADVSEPKPNVYYELGYAQALGKKVITTAQEGTALPFDIFDVPTQFWSSQRELADKLSAQIPKAVGP